MTIPKWCPICKLVDSRYEWNRIPNYLVFECYCPRCGHFKSALHLLNNEDENERDEDSCILSGIVRELNERGEVPEVFGNTIESLLNHALIPKDFKAQAMKL